MARRNGTKNLIEHIAAAQAAETEEGCWPWQGNITEQGYGRFIRRPEPQKKAHRAVYEELVGPLPDDLTLDHLCHTKDRGCPGGPRCRHRRCVNPAHQEPVTTQENLRRSRKNDGVCAKGHQLTPENTYWCKNDRIERKPWRRCRICTLEYNREWRRIHPRKRA